MVTDEAPSRIRRVLRHPVIRLVLFLAAFACATYLQSAVFARLRRLVPLGAGLLAQAVGVALLLIVVHLTYTGMVRLLEGRQATELRAADLASRGGVGLLIGAGLIAAVVAVLWVLGMYEVVGLGTLAAGAGILLLSVGSGYVEEIVVRGILFRILEEGLGTWIALTLTAALFGALHLANPNAGWMGAVTIAATAGVLLAAAYVWTRSLWTAIGIHVAWNFTEGGIFDLPVSGLDRLSLLRARLQGPELLTGGSFGPEASLITLVAGMIVAVLILRRAVRAGQIVPPFWRRVGLGAAQPGPGTPAPH